MLIPFTMQMTMMIIGGYTLASSPLWMLPLLGLLRIRARELVGYSILQFLFHVPLVFFLCWLFSRSIAYMPPTP